MIEKLFYLIACHMLGDYVLQIDFIAKSKGSNYYHLLVHCILYCVPFAFIYGFDWKIIVLFITHVFIDNLKARYNAISYTQDQILHYLIAVLLYV